MSYWGWVWCDEIGSCLGKNSWRSRSIQLQLGTREVRMKAAVDLRQNFVYRMLGALGQHWHKYIILLGKHHIRE